MSRHRAHARLVRRVLQVALEGVGVVQGRVDREVVGDGAVVDVPATFPEAEFVDRAAEGAARLDPFHHARVVPLDALVELVSTATGT